MKQSTMAKLAAEMMSMAGDQFGNHGCNDYDLSSLGFSHEEQVEIVTFMDRENKSSEEDLHRHIAALPHSTDFCLMFACMKWLRYLAAGQSERPAEEETP